MVYPWVIGDVTVPTGMDAEQIFDEPVFAYAEPDLDCGYSWESFELTGIVNTKDGSALLNPDDYITLSGKQRRF